MTSLSRGVILAGEGKGKEITSWDNKGLVENGAKQQYGEIRIELK